MEADAALVLTTKMYEEHGLVINKVVADDDSSMKAVVCHSYAAKEKRPDLFPGYKWPRTSKGNQKNKDGGLLPLHIPEPGWLADPTHRTKVVAKRFFEIQKKGKGYSTITKADCLHMKKYYGYFLKQNQNKTYEKMLAASNTPLEHLFDNHAFCGSWCKRKKELEMLANGEKLTQSYEVYY